MAPGAPPVAAPPFPAPLAPPPAPVCSLPGALRLRHRRGGPPPRLAPAGRARSLGGPPPPGPLPPAPSPSRPQAALAPACMQRGGRCGVRWQLEGRGGRGGAWEDGGNSFGVCRMGVGEPRMIGTARAARPPCFAQRWHHIHASATHPAAHAHFEGDWAGLPTAERLVPAARGGTAFVGCRGACRGRAASPKCASTWDTSAAASPHAQPHTGHAGAAAPPDAMRARGQGVPRSCGASARFLAPNVYPPSLGVGHTIRCAPPVAMMAGGQRYPVSCGSLLRGFWLRTCTRHRVVWGGWTYDALAPA
jgi:hypothetical protein